MLELEPWPRGYPSLKQALSIERVPSLPMSETLDPLVEVTCATE